MFKKRLAYAMGNHPFGFHCSSVAPNPLWLASHLTLVGASLSKCLCSVILVIWFFMVFSASVCCCDHCILLFIMFSFFSSVLIGSSRLAKFGMNLISW